MARCSALHSFVLPSDLSASPTINTIPFEHPLLDFTMIPSEPGRLLVSLDTAWGMLKSNQTGNESSGGKPRKQELSGEDIARMSHNLAVVEGSGDGRVSPRDLYHDHG